MSQSSNMSEIATDALEIIEFYIDQDMPDGTIYRSYYGINVAKVLEIIQRPDITELPNQPHPALLGTFNLRGRVMPLVDLGVCLSMPVRPVEPFKVIVSEYFGVVTAYLVSGVTRIHRLTWKQIETPNAYVQQCSSHSISGVVRIEERLLFLLDMETILTELNPKLGMHFVGGDSEKEEVEGISIADAQDFHILIVDDSTSIRHIIAKTLESVGFRVTATKSGVEAWALLNEWKQEVDNDTTAFYAKVQAIISDIEMPEMDGHTLTKQIKQDSVMQGVPVILFSSLITEALRVKGEAVGADAQIAKPGLSMLSQLVRKTIQDKLGM